MITHFICSSTARLVSVLAVGLAFGALFASSAAKPANADSSQWMISQPESWSGWHMQPWHWNMPNGAAPSNTQSSNAQHWTMQNGNMQGGDFHQGGGDFHHDGRDFHQHGDDHHHFNNGFVIINPVFPNSLTFNQGFVTPAFLGNPPPFIVTQPGFIVGQPFVPGQPHFFVNPQFVHKQIQFVQRHPSLGQPVVIGQSFVVATGGHSMGIPRMHSMHSSGTVFRSGGMHSSMH